MENLIRNIMYCKGLPFTQRFFEYEVTRGLEGKLMIEDEMSLIEIEIHGNQTFPRIIPTALRVNYTYSLVSVKYSKTLYTMFNFLQVMSLLSLVCFHIIPLFVLTLLNLWTFVKVIIKAFSSTSRLKKTSLILGSEKPDKVFCREPKAPERPDHGPGSDHHCPHFHHLPRLQICNQSG